MLVIKVNQNVAVHPVGGQQDQHNEIRNQQRAIEGVGVVKALESLIEKMVAEVGPNALRRSPRGQRRKQDEIRAEQGVRSKFSFYRIRGDASVPWVARAGSGFF